MNRIPTYEECMALTDTVSNHHCLQLVECQAMYETLCELDEFSLIVEVGCDYGRSSSLIYQLASSKQFRTIHVDPWAEYRDRAKQWMEVMCEKCAYNPFVLLRMTTIEAEVFIERLTPNGIHMAFIDGCHDQPVVERDLQIVASRVRPSGFLVVHDYPSGGVAEAVDPFVATGWTKHKQAFGLGIWRRG